MDIPQPRLCPMSLETVEAVEALERECFETPWSLDSLVEELTNPLAVFRVAQVGDEVAGYVGMHHIIDEGYITNIAVAKRFRRQGIASLLLKSLVVYAEENDLSMITLEVRPTNTAGVQLYREFHFEETGRRKEFYRKPSEDALIMTRKI